MPLKWTNATMLDSMLDSYDTALAVELTAAQKFEFLQASENYVETLIRAVSGTDFTYNGERHAILRETAYLRAALHCVASISLSPRTLQEAQLTADIINNALNGNLKLLSDQNYVKFIIDRGT